MPAGVFTGTLSVPGQGEGLLKLAPAIEPDAFGLVPGRGCFKLFTGQPDRIKRGHLLLVIRLHSPALPSHLLLAISH